MQKHLTGAKLQSLDIIWPKVTHNFNLKDYNEKVRGKEVKNLGRIGKYIILNLDNKLIAVHLRMTGKLYVQPKSFDKKKHTMIESEKLEELQSLINFRLIELDQTNLSAFGKRMFL